jgi:hypothetical protein
MVDVVRELYESRDKANIPLESPPDAGDSEQHLRSLDLGNKVYLECFTFDAGYAAGSQPDVERLGLCVGGEKE